VINTKLPPLRTQGIVCPHCESGRRIGIHSHPERRYKCHECGKTFAETVGTPLYGLKYPLWMVTLVLALLSHGCPVQAIVFAMLIDERTIRDWQMKAGAHAKSVQEAVVCKGQVDLGQVQADELYVKGQRGQKWWLATAMSVFSRLFIWGVIAPHRDESLIRRVLEKVRAAARLGQPILFAVDGFTSYVTMIRKVFRDPLHTGKRGRPRLIVWPDVHIVQVIKQHAGRKLVSVERRLAHGCLQAAEAIMHMSQVGWGMINTAYVERLNATFRTWLPALFRRSRCPARVAARAEAAMFWMGAVYNFCAVHHTLAATPAMAADLTDHVWTIDELLRFRLRRE
jgi:transposase-like protein